MPDGGAAVHPDDVMLLAAPRRGNGDATAAVMQRHNRALWRIARGILGDDGVAEEAGTGHLVARFHDVTCVPWRGKPWHLARPHRDQ